jgi:copper transport protein
MSDIPSPRRGVAPLVRMLVLAMIALALIVPSGRALAHAALVAAVPADGAVVATPPGAFSLSFSEPVSPLVLRLVRPDGSSTLLDRFALNDATLDIAAPADLGKGTHVLSWRVISEDGHPVGGSVVFSIGAPSAGGGAPPQEAADPALDAAIWALRTLVYIGLFIGAGGASFIAFIGGRRAAPIVRAAAWLGLAAAPLSIGLLGVDALALPLSSLAAPIAWRTGWSTSYGTTGLVAAAALVLALLSLSTRAARILAAQSLVGVGVALAASGHASAASPQWLTRPAVFLHAVGIAFWAGALIPLAAALRDGGEDSSRALRRFSRAIPVAVAPLAVAGIALAVVQVETSSALWTTAYGRVLLAKLALLGLLFGLAALNRLRLTAAAEEDDPGARRWLRRSIAAEVMLVLAIFGTAALWRFTPPPRALAEAAAEPASIHIHAADAMADLSLTPGHAGTVAAAISVMTGDFGPLDAKEVSLVLANPAAGIEPIRRKAVKGADAVWRIDALAIPIAGRWQVRIDILIDDFRIAKLEDAIDIRP